MKVFPKWISNWRSAHKFQSIRWASIGVAFSAVSTGVNAVYGNLSPITKAAWPNWSEPAILCLIFIGVIVGRLLDQS